MKLSKAETHLAQKAGGQENPYRGWEVEMALVWMLQTWFLLG